MGAVSIPENSAGDEGSTEVLESRRFHAIPAVEAIRAFGLQIPPGMQFTEDFPVHARLLGQIYDSIQRHLTGQVRRSDNYYPSTEDVYQDVQLYRRTVSDKTTYPPIEEFENLIYLLAVQPDPFIHVVREFQPDPVHTLKVVSRFVAPTEKHTDKVTVAFRAVLRNDAAFFRDLVKNKALFKDWAERLIPVKALEDLNLAEERVPHLLSLLYITDPRKDPLWSGRIRKLNESILKNIYRPLLDMLIKDGLAVVFSCGDLRKSYAWASKLQDICLFNSLDQLDNRYTELTRFLESPVCRPLVDPTIFNEWERKRADGSISESEYGVRLAGDIIARTKFNDTAPVQLYNLAAEIFKLGTWMVSQKKDREEKQEVQELTGAVDKIKKHGDVLRVKQGHKYVIPEKFMALFLSGRVPSVLAVSDPPDVFRPNVHVDLSQYDNFYVLYKDRTVTSAAIEKAISVFRRSGDGYLLRLLERVLGLGRVPDSEIKTYVVPIDLAKFRESLNDSYYQFLPWWRRLWLVLTSTEIGDEQVAPVRNRFILDNENRARRIRRTDQDKKTQEAKRQVRQLAESRMAEPREQALPPSAAPASAPVDDEHLLLEIQAFIDGSWDRGIFPVVDDIMKIVRAEKRDSAKRIIDLVNVGAASVKDIQKLDLPTGEKVYITAEYMKSKRDELLERCKRKLQEADEIVIDDRVMSLPRNVNVKDRDVYEVLARTLRLI